MTSESDEWNQRAADLWATIDDHSEEEFLSRADALAAELPDGSPRAAFERASALDATDHSDLAVPLYRAALAAGLPAALRRQAVIQLASSLRDLGQAAESADLLRAEQAQPEGDLDDAVSAFLALALVELGQERAAASLALSALAPHLPRYQRSVANYARLLLDPGDGPPAGPAG